MILINRKLPSLPFWSRFFVSFFILLLSLLFILQCFLFLNLVCMLSLLFFFFFCYLAGVDRPINLCFLFNLINYSDLLTLLRNINISTRSNNRENLSNVLSREQWRWEIKFNKKKNALIDSKDQWTAFQRICVVYISTWNPNEIIQSHTN